MNEPKDRVADVEPEDTDSFDPAYETDLDGDLSLEADPIVIESLTADTSPAPAAWRRLDERSDDQWLKEQLSDWDDWDADLDSR